MATSVIVVFNDAKNASRKFALAPTIAAVLSLLPISSGLWECVLAVVTMMSLAPFYNFIRENSRQMKTNSVHQQVSARRFRVFTIASYVGMLICIGGFVPMLVMLILTVVLAGLFYRQVNPRARA